MPQARKERRKVGLFLATTLVASSMIGSGIFLLPATLAEFGSMTTLGWLIATAGALVVARVLGELGRAAPAAGGACAYVGKALGPVWGFHATAAYWLALWTGNIAIAIAAIGYLAHFVPALAGALPLALAAMALIWVLTLANLTGARRICELESATLFVGLIPIVFVIAAGALRFHPALFREGWNVSGVPAWRGLPPALVLMFWAFAGVESASIGTGFVRDPARNVARATYYGVVAAAAVYVLSCGIIMGLIPAPTLARSTAPFADAARLLLSPGLAALAAGAVALLALIKLLGSLAGWILLTTETSVATAQQGLFPRLFARRGWSLLIAAVLMTAGVAATVSPTLGQQFGELIAVSVIFTLVLYVYACLALWRTGRGRDRGFAAAGLVFCGAVMALSGAEMLLWAAIVLACVYPLYYFSRSQARQGAGKGQN
ncbi:MAG: amino acid permease [Terriglobales bacterium]